MSARPGGWQSYADKLSACPCPDCRQRRPPSHGPVSRSVFRARFRMQWEAKRRWYAENYVPREEEAIRYAEVGIE